MNIWRFQVTRVARFFFLSFFVFFLSYPIPSLFVLFLFSVSRSSVSSFALLPLCTLFGECRAKINLIQKYSNYLFASICALCSFGIVSARPFFFFVKTFHFMFAYSICFCVHVFVAFVSTLASLISIKC